MRKAIATLLLAATAARGDVPEALASARRALVADLEKLAQWCTDNQVYLDRNATYELILRFDPDHREARQWLKYVLRNGTWVRETAYERPRNMNAKADADYKGRRVAVVGQFADAIVAMLNTDGERWPREVRRRALDDALAADPDNEKARAMNGQVCVGGRWMMEETVRAAERRRMLVRAGRAALAAVPEPRPAEVVPSEAALGVPWTGALETATWRVVSSTSFEEMRQAARIAEASTALFEDCFGVTMAPRPGQAIYLMTDESQYRSVVTRHPASTTKFRNFALQLNSSWVPETHHLLVYDTDVRTRLEFAARQPLDSLLTRKFGIGSSLGWAVEGVGLYLTELLTGSHYTFFVRQTEYARDDRRPQTALWKRLREPDADWFEIGRELVRDGKRPDFAFLMSKDVNTMDAEDLILAYVLGAWLLEAQAEKAPDLLREIGKEKVPFHDAIPKVLGLDVPTLQDRVLAWLDERGG